MTDNLSIQASANTYDEVPYISYPYAQSNPEHLRTMGVLFGMNPPKIETARILELGCSQGGNIIPHAIKYPKAKFVGIDLSKVQIDTGIAQVEALKLKNIELKHFSITDITKDLGEFDYIICHGVISWVPEPVREKIFAVCRENISKNGIAYVSYNTLPGWNMVRSIRDMMLYHSNGFQNPQEKVNQSRLLLDFIKKSTEEQKTAYSDVLKQEADILANQSDYYLRHDHLEEDNKQFYFHEFMKNADQNDMQYLSDTSLASMYIGNMPQKAMEALKQINDIVRTEQYMDFITNRRFRSTLLCRKGVKLNRNLTIDTIKKMSLSFDVATEKELTKEQITGSESVKFSLKNSKDNHISTSSKGLKAALCVFAELKGQFISYTDLVKKANAKLGNNSKSIIEQDLDSNLLNLIVKGLMNLSSEVTTLTKPNKEKPKVTKLASYQATSTAYNWVTGPRHSAVAITGFDKVVIKYMDGTNSKSEILEKIIQDIKDGKINASKDNKPLTKDDDITAEVENVYNQSLERICLNGLLESA